MNYLSNLSYSASRLVYWGRCKLEELKWKWVRAYTAYSLNGGAHISNLENLFHVIFTQKNDGKTLSFKHLDWVQRRFIVFPKENKQHFIAESTTVQKVLYQERNGDNLRFGQQHLVEPITAGNKNMLLCESKNHMELRKPLEKSFSPRHLAKSAYAEEITYLSLSFMSKHGQSYVGNLCHIVPFFSILFVLGFTGSPGPYVDFLMNRNADKIKEQIKADYKAGNYEEGKGMDALQKAEDAKELTEEEKISETLLMLVAGVHTTSTLIEFAIQELFNHPEYVAGVNEEWKQFIFQEQLTFKNEEEYLAALNRFIFGENGSKGSRLLEYVYLEVQRLHPPIPDIQRVAKNKTELDGIKIDKEDELHLNIAACHRDSKFFKDPNEFKPDRFEDPKARTHLMTFSLGSQSCIGKHLVPIEVKIVLGLLVTLFDWKAGGKKDVGTDHFYKYDGLVQTLIQSSFFGEGYFSKKKEYEPILKEAFEKPHPFLNGFNS